MNTIVQVAGTDVIYARMRAEGRKIGAILEPSFIIGYSWRPATPPARLSS
jgi:hypothetical protein